jgi:hypothetical protein
MFIETIDLECSLFLKSLNRAIDRKFLQVAVKASSALHMLQVRQDRKTDLMIANVGTQYNNL